MVNSYDIVVLGAGVAGLNTSQLLGSLGLRVCLIDSKNDPTEVSFYTLGSYIDLDKFGLSKNVIAVDIDGGYIHSTHFTVKKKCKGYILNKKNLYKELFSKATENNVSFISTEIESYLLNEDGTIQSVADKKGNKFEAKIFVDASGIEGFFSRKFGLQDKSFNTAIGVEYNVEYKGPQNFGHLFIGSLYRGGYGWLFPLGNNRAIFGFGSFNAEVKTELKQRLDKILETAAVKKLVTKDNDKITGGTIPVTDVKTRFVYKNIICVGDSVSQVNPLVGEGHSYILEASCMAARAINNAIKQNNLELMHSYEEEWKENFYELYKLGKQIQISADKSSKHDLRCDFAILALKMKSDESVARIITGHVTKKDTRLPLMMGKIAGILLH